MMPLWWPLVLASLLFSLGVYGVLARRNAVQVLMAIELMLNAVNLNLVAFDAYLRDVVHSGQVLTLFVIVIAAAEIGLGLAIVLLVFRTHAGINIDEMTELADRDDVEAADEAADKAADKAGARV
jgi:NADH-quinone oxidoreductase subunit K